jgi:hypothetical protein
VLAPHEKYRQGKNDTIQIIVTHACNLACSNCTQLLPFRRDARFMSLDCFRTACESLRDWPGIVGVFGGNPCTHPHFPQLCEIISEIIHPAHRGLWTNNLMKHGEIAAKTFRHGRLNLNAHADEGAAREIDRWFPGRLIESSRSRPSWHSPILLDRRDFGVSDDEWTQQRENCDINQRWSAAIAERDSKPYGYFCEVAAALDGIRGENHGIPCEPGWWQRPMAEFDYQVGGCCDRGCGVPLKGLGHLDREDTFDISPAWTDATAKPRGKVLVQLHEAMPEQTEQPTDYQARWTRKPEVVA